MSWRHHQIERRLRRLGIPDPPAPYTVEAWCAAIGARRGRPLHLVPLALQPGEPAGALWVLNQADCIYFRRSDSPINEVHSILHELAHCIYDHTGVDIATPNRVNSHEEEEAELTAAVMAWWLVRHAARAKNNESRHPSRSSTPRSAGGGSLSRTLHAVTSSRTARTVRCDLRRRWIYSPYLQELCAELRRVLRTSAEHRAVTTDGDQTMRPVDNRIDYYRLVIEITDYLHQLRPYLRDDVRANARRRALRAALDPRQVDIVADAAAIGAALRDIAAGIPPAQGTAAPTNIRKPTSLSLSLDREEIRLVKVADALATSPYVRAELAAYRYVENTPADPLFY